MNKIINDPVHGFIHTKFDIILELINHPFFQRLRNIVQLGLTNYVYPGANHTRFHHALGAFHLMQEAIKNLREKGIQISEQEEEAACIAILLHDIGHGPFSHTLEHSILKGISHEEISLYLMKQLNISFNGRMTLAIEMFQNRYHRKFFFQLISSQLDVDRMDYLSRDSFFTGVKEGKINVDRILKMLYVKDNQLVVEEKGALSIESYLIARKIMYWQVYIHKTVLSVEQMLVQLFRRIEDLKIENKFIITHNSLDFFLKNNQKLALNEVIIDAFIKISDSDVWHLLKNLQTSEDRILNYLSNAIINRRLLKSKSSVDSFEHSYKIKDGYDPNYLIFQQKIDLTTYSNNDGIMILKKDGSIQSLHDYSIENGFGMAASKNSKYYLFFPEGSIDFIN
jgi:HD superfamily phosphohydrolase